MCVRNPAGLFAASRSMPMIPPSNIASATSPTTFHSHVAVMGFNRTDCEEVNPRGKTEHF
jgi:hypothetical protein